MEDKTARSAATNERACRSSMTNHDEQKRRYIALTVLVAALATSFSALLPVWNDPTTHPTLATAELAIGITGALVAIAIGAGLKVSPLVLIILGLAFAALSFFHA